MFAPRKSNTTLGNGGVVGRSVGPRQAARVIAPCVLRHRRWEQGHVTAMTSLRTQDGQARDLWPPLCPRVSAHLARVLGISALHLLLAGGANAAPVR